MESICISNSPRQFERILILLVALMIIASTIACTDHMIRCRTARKGRDTITDSPEDIEIIYDDIVKDAQDETEPEREDEEPIPPAADYQNLSESEKSIGEKVWDEILN